MITYNSPHIHFITPLTGSTVAAFLKKATELKRTYVSYTDIGSFHDFLKVYTACKKINLKFMGGIEILFKDSDCEIFNKSLLSKTKYFKATIFAPTQEAFKCLSQLSSKKGRLKTIFQNKNYPVGLWTWADLEEASRAGCVYVGSDLHDMVAKYSLVNDHSSALAVAKKLQNLFKQNLYFTITGCKQDRYFKSFVKISLQDGSEILLNANSKIYVYNTQGKELCVNTIEVVNNPFKFKAIGAYINNDLYIKKSGQIKKAEVLQGYYKFEQGDLQLTANKMIQKLASVLNIPLLYSDQAYYANKTDKIVQDVRLAADERRESVHRYMQSGSDAMTYLTQTMGMPEMGAEEFLMGMESFYKRFDGFSLEYQYQLPEPEGNALKEVYRLIQENGRMKWEDPAYKARLLHELNVLTKNGTVDLLPYFLPIVGALNNNMKNGVLNGPSRGSAGGSLLAYLIGITHTDPIVWNLSFERFLSVDRIANGDYPDIDVDQSTRDLLAGEDGQSGYLFGRYGDKVAQVSTQQMLRLKSSIKDVNRYFNDGKVLPEIEEITKALPNPPQGVNDYAFVHGFTDTDGNNILGIIDTDETLKKYVKQYPEEWAIVEKCLGIVRGVSKHASAFLISNTPIADVVPMTDEGATQYDAKGCEAAKLIKYDFLIVNNLKDIQDCIKRINKKNNIDLPTGYFMHEGKKLFIWDLPEDSKVYASIENGNTETLFQISTNVMRPLVEKIKPKNILDGAVILALGRPGPLDYIDPKTGRNMAEEYIERRNGGGSAPIPEMLKLLPETYGIQIYQELTSKVAREIGKMTAIEAETLRRHFSKKNKTKAMEMKPIFMKGAVETVDKETAEIIWSQMETSSRYSFNKSHSVGYFYITYACMFLKYYYPLEWWASILSNASEEEISGELMRHVRDMVSPPDIRLSESEEMVVDYENKKILSKLTVLKGLGKATADKIIEARPYNTLQAFADKKPCSIGVAQKLITVGLFDSFYPNPNINNILKVNAYAQCVAETEYQEKIKAGKTPKERGDKELHTMFQESISPIQRYLLKKKIFPSMPLNLSEIMRTYSTLKHVGAKKGDKVCFDNSSNKSVKYLTGDEINSGTHWLPWDTVEFCFAAYVNYAKEFSWKDKKTGYEKKRLALKLECDGRDIDTVLWQDRYTNKLEYPKELKEGCIAIFFCTKYQDRPFYPYEIIVEKTSLPFD